MKLSKSIDLIRTLWNEVILICAILILWFNNIFLKYEKCFDTMWSYMQSKQSGHKMLLEGINTPKNNLKQSNGVIWNKSLCKEQQIKVHTAWGNSLRVGSKSYIPSTLKTQMNLSVLHTSFSVLGRFGNFDKVSYFFRVFQNFSWAKQIRN